MRRKKAGLSERAHERIVRAPAERLLTCSTQERQARQRRKERYLSLQEHELLLSRDQGFIRHLTGEKVVLYMFIKTLHFISVGHEERDRARGKASLAWLMSENERKISEFGG
jgi:hypothetical protein